MGYEERVAALEAEGLTTSDAQGVVDAQDMKRGKKITREKYAAMDRLERERIPGRLGVLLFLDHVGNISDGGKRDLAAMLGE